MSLRDKISHAKHELHWVKDIDATETPGTGVDLKGYGSATILCSIGELTGISSPPTESWTFKLQESDTVDDAFSNVDESDMLLEYGNNDGSVTNGVFATIDAAGEAEANYSVGYIGSEQYIRVVATAAGSPGFTPIAVSVIKEAYQKPASE